MKALLCFVLLSWGVPTNICSFPEPTPVIHRTEPVIIPKLVRTGFRASRKAAIDTLVIHSSYNKTGGDIYSVEKILKIYAHYQVSAHYLIDRKGDIYQLVKDADTSYHTGMSKMPDGRTGVNHFSLGIELLNRPGDQYTEAQYQALTKLVACLKKRYKISSIVGHGQIAPKRKSDPWNFDWQRLSAL